ncbi:MAG: tetratricopeptide repeat protein [Alphaproteobacteria bacterium]|nr:tetratricopeptide repeat protein [Alphaproteobacteria bacterium]
MRVSLRRISAATACAVLLAASGCASVRPEQNLTGDYLSARFAAGVNAVDAAAKAYAGAYAAAPHETALLREAFFFKLATGDIDAAQAEARAILASEGGGDDGLARTALAVASVKAGRFKEARDRLRGDVDVAFLKSVGFLMDVWIEDGLAGPKAALAKLDDPGKGIFAGFNPLHKALLAQAAGETDVAKASYQEAVASLGGPVAREAYGAFLERAGDNEAARDYYASLLDQSGTARRLGEAGLARLDRGAASHAYESVTPAQGSAIALYAFASALIQSAADQRQRALEAGFSVGQPSFNLPLVLAQMALYLDPGLDDARRLIGTIYDVYGDHESAARILRGIAPSSPLYEDARVEIATSLVARGETKEAIAMLKKAIRRNPTGRDLRLTLANLYASRNDNEKAVKTLDGIIEHLPAKPHQDAWRYYVARGASLLELNRWPEAEADLKRAVELAPDEPTALNYLGYSWAERGVHLKEAFKLIERAVAALPQSGAIVDSLGWAHYQLGQYEDAVDNLERAAALEPSDPTITDHLGDAYWRLGRKIEARYQWRRALELEPTDKQKSELNRKLAQGLPPAPAQK